MKDSGLTSYLRVGNVFQLGEHDIEGHDCFIIAMYPVKRFVL